MQRHMLCEQGCNGTRGYRRADEGTRGTWVVLQHSSTRVRGGRTDVAVAEPKHLVLLLGAPLQGSAAHGSRLSQGQPRPRTGASREADSKQTNTQRDRDTHNHTNRNTHNHTNIQTKTQRQTKTHKRTETMTQRHKDSPTQRNREQPKPPRRWRTRVRDRREEMVGSRTGGRPRAQAAVRAAAAIRGMGKTHRSGGRWRRAHNTQRYKNALFG